MTAIAGIAWILRLRLRISIIRKRSWRISETEPTIRQNISIDRLAAAVSVAQTDERGSGYEGTDVVMGIRPEDIHDDELFISNSGNTFEADVDVTEPMGAETYLYLTLLGKSFIARVNPRTTAKPGDRIKVAFDATKIHLFDKETEKAIIN